MLDEETDISPEHRLWRAVIRELIFDIQNEYIKYKQSLNGSRSNHYENLQRLLNVANDSHLEFICDLADYNYELFVEGCYKIAEGVIEIEIPRHEYFVKKRLNQAARDN